VSGMGLGTFLFVPVSQFFIDTVGWLPQEKSNYNTQVSHLFIQ